jgi:hypothetical protein
MENHRFNPTTAPNCFPRFYLKARPPLSLQM